MSTNNNSPGGQDALKALDDLAAFCSDDAATVDRHVAVIRAALAARQPAGDQVVVTQFRHSECTDWYDVTDENQHVLTDPDFEKRTLYAAPTAQAVDLGQLPSREVVEFWHRFGYRDEATKLLALIDGHSNSGSIKE